MFTKRELLHLFISVIILGFVFGFDDGRQIFILSDWLTNFFGFFIIIAISLLFRELVIKLFAKRHDAKSEYELWGMGRFWFSGKLAIKKKVPIGLFVAFVITVASRGKLFFTALGSHQLQEFGLSRTGRKHPTLNYFEEAQICSMGMLANLFLTIIALLIGRIFDVNVGAFVTVNFFIVLFNMIPFSTLDGAKIFFGSLLMYIFVLVFIVVAFLLIKYSIILSLIIAFLVACVATFVYFFNWG